MFVVYSLRQENGLRPLGAGSCCPVSLMPLDCILYNTSLNNEMLLERMSPSIQLNYVWQNSMKCAEFFDPAAQLQQDAPAVL